MSNLPWNLALWPPNWLLIIAAGILHCAIGSVAAIVAKNKGHDFSIWLPLGLFAGTPALIAAWRLQPQPMPSEQSSER